MDENGIERQARVTQEVPLEAGSFLGAVSKVVLQLEARGKRVDRLVVDPMGADALAREGVWTREALANAAVRVRVRWAKPEVKRVGYVKDALPDVLGLKVVLGMDLPPLTFLVLAQEADLVQELKEARDQAAANQEGYGEEA